MDWELILDWFKIVIIDLTLAGDNALVIAMAVQTLPSRQQRLGIVWGSIGAVCIRVIITFIAAQFLQLPLVQLGGGILLLWIAVKLLRQSNGGETKVRDATTLWQAVWVIILADLIMSTDNVLAVAGASEGNFYLLLFGLGLSIPIVVIGAVFVSILMSRFGWLVLVGAAVLGEVSGKMSLEDHFITNMFGAPPKPIEWAVRMSLAGLLVLVGLFLSKQSQPVPESGVIK